MAGEKQRKRTRSVSVLEAITQYIEEHEMWRYGQSLPSAVCGLLVKGISAARQEREELPLTQEELVQFQDQGNSPDEPQT